MGVTRRTRAAALAAAAASMLLAPVTEAASLEVRCLVAYASTVPARCEQGVQPPIDKVTPISDLFGSGPAAKGVVVVEGNATPGTQVTVTLSDGISTMTRIGSAAAAADPGNGRRAGDFEVIFDPSNDPEQPASVQELGTHSARAGASNSSTDPADLGASVLIVEARASNGSSESAPASTQIIKLAATPNDTTPPALLDLRFPPEHWCHWSGPGVSIAGQGLGGDAKGSCGRVSASGVGAAPDVTWALCLNETSIPELRDQYCSVPPERAHPPQTASVSGWASDLSEASQGLASEISSVTVLITQGNSLVRTYEDIARRTDSTSGRWGFSLSINDFAPTWPRGVPYQVVVTASDAWGNEVSASSGPINVYPW